MEGGVTDSNFLDSFTREISLSLFVHVCGLRSGGWLALHWDLGRGRRAARHRRRRHGSRAARVSRGSDPAAGGGGVEGKKGRFARARRAKERGRAAQRAIQISEQSSDSLLSSPLLFVTPAAFPSSVLRCGVSRRLPCHLRSRFRPTALLSPPFKNVELSSFARAALAALLGIHPPFCRHLVFAECTEHDMQVGTVPRLVRAGEHALCI